MVMIDTYNEPAAPPAPTGCARHDAVIAMLHHLESTYRWETEWDNLHEDTYWEGEMTSHRRIVLPRKDTCDENRMITFIFVEDKLASYCYLYTDDGEHCSLLTKEDYDVVMAALDAGWGVPSCYFEVLKA